MGIYIPKMEMPSKKNGAVIILYPNGTAVFEDGKEYQVVEVKPHGKLIDADALMENEENISFKDEWHMTVTEAFVSVKNIAHAPTIIEAEVEE